MFLVHTGRVVDVVVYFPHVVKVSVRDALLLDEFEVVVEQQVQLKPGLEHTKAVVRKRLARPERDDFHQLLVVREVLVDRVRFELVAFVVGDHENALFHLVRVLGFWRELALRPGHGLLVLWLVRVVLEAAGHDLLLPDRVVVGVVFDVLLASLEGVAQLQARLAFFSDDLARARHQDAAECGPSFLGDLPAARTRGDVDLRQVLPVGTQPVVSCRTGDLALVEERHVRRVGSGVLAISPLDFLELHAPSVQRGANLIPLSALQFHPPLDYYRVAGV
mmetsp:Transcript_21517/g.38164  ORF Transcript_21517/g.38164 Transcript_21517/m.38164 type:complete len:277 (+) Transcript_21517:1701-2531(+)